MRTARQRLMDNQRRFGRRYTEEEKERVIRARLIDGLSLRDAAALIGASPTTLRNWLYKLRDKED